MEPNSESLLDRIVAFEIDERPKALSFTKRLARENGWSLRFAQRVVTEYKRFICLCMEAGHPCTPSDQVDQAWHLHLTYTKSYWERLNGEILPRPLHHNPTEGGSKEDAKFDDWYAKTKESYARIFGAPPPLDIWPPSEVRFGEDVAYERINTRRNWIIPKRRVRFAGAGLLAVALLAGCGATGGPVTLLVAVAIMGGAILLTLLFVALIRPSQRKNRGEDMPGDDSSWSSTYATGGDGGGWTSGHSSSSHGHSHSYGDGHSHSHGDSHGGDGHSGCGSDGGSSGCASSGCGGGGCGGGGCSS